MDMLKQRKNNWRETVLVCRKCTRKIRGGFGENGRTPLAKALRKALGVKKGRRGAIGFVEVGCFGLCPKRAATIALGSAPGTLFAVPRDTPAADVASALGLDRVLGDAPATKPSLAKPGDGLAE